MKAVIDRKTYDTDTAEFLIRYCADCPDNDFNYYEERLYKKKKTGEYFIHGMGGALSPYRKIYDDGNTLGWGETISLLTEEEAKEWVTNHFDEIDYEHIFGQKKYKKYKVSLLRPFYVEADVEANDVKEAYTKFEELLDNGKLELKKCGDFYNQCPQVREEDDNGCVKFYEVTE